MAVANQRLWMLGLLIVAASSRPTESAGAETDKKGSKVTNQAFGKLADGTETKLFSFTNANGVTMKVTDYGARLVAVETPDRNGKIANVTLGLDSGPKYEAHTAFFGCTTGRFANRIAKGRFTLDGKEYQLATNIAPNHLHGGKKGFDRYVWKSESVSGPSNSEGVKFSFQSPDGDEGYPGTLSVTVTYLLTEKDEVQIDYTATTDKPTVLNLTNHAYWNLAGAGQGDVLSHKLTIAADNFLAVDGALIPTGKFTPVAGTYMDFTQPHAIGERIAETKKGTPNPNGYDHCYVIRGPNGELNLAARAEDPSSGRVMEVYTTEPGVQLYAANFLDGDPKNGSFKQHTAFCLETQHFPDSPNQPSFPTTVLRPGETYKQTTVHKFSVKK
jgi:aldose 1-epimerase